MSAAFANIEWRINSSRTGSGTGAGVQQEAQAQNGHQPRGTLVNFPTGHESSRSSLAASQAMGQAASQATPQAMGQFDKPTATATTTTARATAALSATASLLWRSAAGIALAALLGLQLWQLLGGRLNIGGLDVSGCGAASTHCLDTGWQPATNKASSIYFFRHRLGATPRVMSVWFSPTADGERAYLISHSFPSANAGNPVTIEARADIILLHTWSGAPIHGIYDGSTEKWTTYSDGFFRVVAMK